MTEQELRERIIERSPDRLLLDLENPRFGLAEAEDQNAALRLLAERADLKELWGSIAERGFESFEPLVGYETAKGSDQYIIVEGNRRLAAVKTLLAPQLLEGIRSVSVPVVGPRERASMDALPVFVVKNRDEADDYIGFKHINGPQTWGSLAKAKFAVQLYNKIPPSVPQDQRVTVLSKRLGDSRQLILRTLVAFKIFEQARELGFLSVELVESNAIDFSHLYTMLQSPATRQYLGLPDGPLNDKLVMKNPVPATHREKLRFLMSWLFGDENSEPIMKRQGTDRPKLQKVLASVDATETLEITGDFERAVEEAGFGVDDWFGATVRMEALSKRVSDGITDLPSDLEAELVSKASNRLMSSSRNVTSAMTLLDSLFGRKLATRRPGLRKDES